MAYVEGRLQTEKYTDKQGIERYATKIRADVLQLLGSRSYSPEQDRGRQSPQGGGALRQRSDYMSGSPEPDVDFEPPPFRRIDVHALSFKSNATGSTGQAPACQDFVRLTCVARHREVAGSRPERASVSLRRSSRDVCLHVHCRPHPLPECQGRDRA